MRVFGMMFTWFCDDRITHEKIAILHGSFKVQLLSVVSAIFTW